MHPSKRLLGTALSPLLKSHSFRKRGLTWHRPFQDMIQVFHIDKSRWGADNYSLHLGIYPRTHGREITPPHHRCPIQTNLDNLVRYRKAFWRDCDFEDRSLTLQRRLKKLTRAVEKYAIPWLDAHSSIADLQRLVATDYETLLPKVQVWRDTYDYLRALPRAPRAR
jgi:uncharacterized protein DUF4304